MSKVKFLASVPLIIGVFIIIYASLGMMYYQRYQESRDLETQNTLSRALLQKPSPDIDGLRKQLETHTGSQPDIDSLPRADQGVDIYAALVAEGRKGSIDILNIKAAPAIAPPQGSSGETALPYSMVIKGSHEGTLAFISSLTRATGLLEGLELRSITIRSGGSSSEPDSTELGLYVHTWSGDAGGGEAAGQAGGSKK